MIAAKIRNIATDRARLTALVGSGSRVFALGCQFLVVIILARIMDKSAFGDFMIAFAVYRVIAMGVGTGLASMVLYHVSRGEGEGRTALDIRLHRSALLAGTGVGIVLWCALWVGAPHIAAMTAKPGLAFWLRTMAPFMLVSLLSTITTGSLEGRSKVATSIVLTEVAPNFLRVALLAPMILVSGADRFVALAMTLSVTLPWIVAVLPLLRTGVRGVARLTRWDIGYSAKLTLYNFAAMQVQGIDMIVAGWLFPSERVAEYAIASRLAALFPFFLQLQVRIFAPVAGKLLASDDRQRLQHEVLRVKDTAMVMVTATVAFLLLSAPIFFALFWDSRALPVLLLLMAFPPVYRGLFAAGDRLLQVAGHANWNLGIMLTALGIVVLIPVAGRDVLGIYSLPVAMILSGLLLNPVIAAAVWRTLRLRLLRAEDAIVVGVAASCTIIPLLTLSGIAAVIAAGSGYLLLTGYIIVRLKMRRSHHG